MMKPLSLDSWLSRRKAKEQLDDVLDTRGPASYIVTKVKGHATEEDITKGMAALTDKLGTDEADALAVARALRKLDREPLETSRQPWACSE